MHDTHKLRIDHTQRSIARLSAHAHLPVLSPSQPYPTHKTAAPASDFKPNRYSARRSGTLAVLKVPAGTAAASELRLPADYARLASVAPSGRCTGTAIRQCPTLPLRELRLQDVRYK